MQDSRRDRDIITGDSKRVRRRITGHTKNDRDYHRRQLFKSRMESHRRQKKKKKCNPQETAEDETVKKIIGNVQLQT